MFHFNRIMIEFASYALRNQQQFLQKRMVKKSDSLSVFEGADTINLRPLGQPGESWDFTDSIEAIVLLVQPADVFGQTDSVKTIVTTSGAEILLSKCCGIIAWNGIESSDYQLVGLQGAVERGLLIPGFQDYFDFQLGDTFKTSYSNSRGDCSLSEQSYFLRSEQFLVQHLETSDSSINIGGHYQTSWYSEYLEGGNGSTTGGSSHGIMNVTNYREKQLADAYPRQCIRLDNTIKFGMIHSGLSLMGYLTVVDNDHDSFYTSCSLTTDQDGLKKKIGGSKYYFEASPMSDTLLVYNPELPQWYCQTRTLSIIYKQRLGPFEIDLSNGDKSYSYRVVGRKRLGVEVGDCCDPWQSLSTTETDAWQTVSAHPNPVRVGQMLNLDPSIPFSHYRVTDTSGKIWMDRSLDYSKSIQIQLPIGFYFLELLGKDGKSVLPIVVQH